jgi:ABC-type transport system substrate-binding protein
VRTELTESAELEVRIHSPPAESLQTFGSSRVFGAAPWIPAPPGFPTNDSYTVGLNLQTSGPDPDPILDLFYGCGSSVNWDGYCNKEVDQLIEQQSMEGDPTRRKQILWQIEHKLAEEDVRPIIFYANRGFCRGSWVKNEMEPCSAGWRSSRAI